MVKPFRQDVIKPHRYVVQKSLPGGFFAATGHGNEFATGTGLQIAGIRCFDTLLADNQRTLVGRPVYAEAGRAGG